MLQSNAAHHAEALFSQLERSSRNPVRLYRHLLQRAAAQLDAVTADAKALRATVHLLQRQQRAQEKCIYLLEAQLAQTQARCERHAARRGAARKTKVGRARETPALPSSSSSSSLVAPRVGQPQQQQQQQPRGDADGCLSTSWELRGVGGRRFTSHSALERTGYACGGSPPSRHASPLAMSASLPPPQVCGESDARQAAAGDKALLEQALGSLLLLLLDDFPSASPAASGVATASPRALAGGAKRMYDTVVAHIRTLKKREGALKSHMQELEETLRRERRRSPQFAIAEEQHTKPGAPLDLHEPKNSLARDDHLHSSRHVCAAMDAAAPSAEAADFTDPHHSVTHSTASSSPPSVGRGDSGNATVRAPKAVMDPSAILDVIQYGTHGMLLPTDVSEEDFDETSLDGLAGEAELLEYAEWKDSFLQQLLPSR
ncbi:uncharacterized protein Tco025E_00725 [Trypanosoma conorhini]|uniref:Uncharacterized protein n=1 Tax=Trypanosoma conorhini TaxID=83891 RepID=A0A3R7LLJ0_9TRYP|nr:uncharacterized protein Tco025E_00725 [Trypanosoma conorhini]RNF27067.1 hypothetical protein Tco025E_00725 [Trypanosoma conorhini]